MIRTSLLSLLLAPAICAAAQQPAATIAQPPAGSNWQHVQALPVGASISVSAKSRRADCKLKSVDADTLTCTQKRDIVFARTEIQSISIPRRGRSALIGMAIGAGAGATLGAATAGGSAGWRGIGAIIVAVPGAPIGAAIGGLTDFAKSAIYKAQ